MPTARGFVETVNNRLVVTFDIDGSLHHLSIFVKPSSSGLECSTATLTYESGDNLVRCCSWSVISGKSDLYIDLGRGVWVTGLFDVPRSSSVRVRGVAKWTTGTRSRLDLPNSANEQEESEWDGFVSRFQRMPGSFDVVEYPDKLEYETKLLKSGAPIIAFLGESSTGKSTFINLITSEKQKVGRGLQSCTSDINIIEAKISGKPVVVIDTPGIDDTRAGMKEADILVGIAHRLEAMAEQRVWVTGVIFLHRISDNKFSSTPKRIFDMLKTLCGDAEMNRLMLCITMCDKVSEDEGYDRLDELCETGAWKEMLSEGASTAMISSVGTNAKADADEIINVLIKNARPVELAILEEMINQGKNVAETGAGAVLNRHLREERAQAEREMAIMRDIRRKENWTSAAKEEEAISQGFHISESQTQNTGLFSWLFG